MFNPSYPGALGRTGRRVWREGRSDQVYHVDDPTAIADVFAALDGEAGQALRAIDTIEKMRDCYGKPPLFIKGVYPKAVYHVFVHAALGEIDEALAQLVYFDAVLAAKKVEVDPIAELRALLKAGDRRGVAAYLMAIERRMVDTFKLTRFWEPSPLPVWPEG